MEALNLFHQVYGPLHVDIATCYRYNYHFAVLTTVLLSLFGVREEKVGNWYLTLNNQSTIIIIVD